jgi:hypothetical protein
VLHGVLGHHGHSDHVLADGQGLADGVLGQPGHRITGTITMVGLT